VGAYCGSGSGRGRRGLWAGGEANRRGVARLGALECVVAQKVAAARYKHCQCRDPTSAGLTQSRLEAGAAGYRQCERRDSPSAGLTENRVAAGELKRII
jgi:hypothetical protein